ncbi:hypothetical protein D918_04708 [Trichuris suis]|nr:hypothetical protein D918_04708 [Trichuris suis]
MRQLHIARVCELSSVCCLPLLDFTSPVLTFGAMLDYGHKSEVIRKTEKFKAFKADTFQRNEGKESVFDNCPPTFKICLLKFIDRNGIVMMGQIIRKENASTLIPNAADFRFHEIFVEQGDSVRRNSIEVTIREGLKQQLNSVNGDKAVFKKSMEEKEPDEFEPSCKRTLSLVGAQSSAQWICSYDQVFTIETLKIAPVLVIS